MALTGKPSVIEPRPAGSGEPSAALRPLQQAVASIRERLRLIEIEINALLTRVSDLEQGGTGSTSEDVDELRADINDLIARVQALEALVPTDWYVNGTLVGTRPAVNFIRSGGITILGSDDDANNRVNITFSTTGIDLTLAITRGSLVMAGREATFALGKFIDVQRGALGLRGRDVALALSNDTLLAITRGRLNAVGRTVGVVATGDLALAVDRGRLTLAGRAVVLAPTLVVQRGAAKLLGRNVAIDIATFDFFREFSDFSTADLTSYKGTIDASTGNLVGTPDSGSVHQRVYFDLLPPGSPSEISGAFDITCNIDLSGSLTANTGVLIFTQGDDGSTNLLQNGYWVDLLFSSVRLVRAVSGTASVLNSAAHSLSPGVHELRVTHDGSGNYEIFLNGVSKFTHNTTTFSAGRFGLFFFGNPGPVPAVVDYGINYTA